MIHCATCASIGRCEDAIRNGNLVRCPYFGDLSRQVAPQTNGSEETCKNCKYHHDTDDRIRQERRINSDEVYC